MGIVFLDGFWIVHIPFSSIVKKLISCIIPCGSPIPISCSLSCTFCASWLHSLIIWFIVSTFYIRIIYTSYSVAYYRFLLLYNVSASFVLSFVVAVSLFVLFASFTIQVFYFSSDSFRGIPILSLFCLVPAKIYSISYVMFSVEICRNTLFTNLIFSTFFQPWFLNNGNRVFYFYKINSSFFFCLLVSILMIYCRVHEWYGF